MAYTTPRGLYPPMVTPFSGDGLNLPAARRHARALRDAGAQGLVVAGSGGEFIALSLDERRALVEAVADEIAGTIPLMVCAAEYATDRVIALSRHAQACGAGSVMITAPYYMGVHRDGVRRHFEAVRAAIDIPIVLYNTGAAGATISLDETERMVDAGVVQALKQSFYDGYHVRDAKQTLGDRAAVFCGHDGSALEALIGGADGWTSIVPLVCTARARRLWDDVQRGAPLADLLAQWRALLPLVRFSFDDSLKVAGSPHPIEVLKTAVNLTGQAVGPPRLPFALLCGAEEARLRAILADLDALPH